MVWVPLSLPPSLRAWDSGVFKELKSLFSTTPEVEKETEANGGHRGDRTLHRTRSWYDRTCLVSTAQTRVLGFAPARPVTHGTGASNQVPRRNCGSQGRSDAGHVRSHMIGRVRSLKELTGL
jgi:hypothetical protein